MAYITIPALPAGSALTGLEQFESVQSATSVKLTAAQIKAFCANSPSLTIDDTNLNGVSIAATFTHIVTGTPAVGIGVGINFDTEISVGNNVTGGSITSVSTDASVPNDDFALAFSTRQNGALAERARFGNDGYFGIGTTSPNAPLDATIVDTNNAVVSVGAAVTHRVSAPGSGIGVALKFRTSTGLTTVTDGAQLSAIATSITSTLESFDLAIGLTIGGATNQEVVRITSSRRLGLNTSTPAATLEVVNDNAATSTVLSVAQFTRTVSASGVPGVGIGAQIDIATETAISVNKVSASIYSISTGLLSGAENFDLGLSTMVSGVNTEIMRLTSARNVGINISTPVTALHVVDDDPTTNTVLPVARLTRTTSGTPGVGIGASLQFEAEAQIGANRIGGVIESVSTSIGAGTENFDLVFRTMTAGAAATEKFKIGSTSITPSVQFSQFGAGVAPTATAYIRAGTSSFTVAPMQFDTAAPILLATATNGAFDFNGQALYFTPQNLERGVVATRQTYVNTAGTRAGPNAINTAQAVTVTGGSSTMSGLTAVPGSAIGNTGCLVIFAASVAPTGITLGVPYWVNWLTATTMTVSATQGGTPITPTTAGTSVTATFLFPILGNGLTSVGLNLAANTRYQYDLYFTISHTGAAATSVSYGLANFTGTLSAHGYRVTSQGSTAAISGNLTGVANTSSSYLSNYITSGFSTTVVVTGVTAATANTTNIVQIQGQIDTVTACTYVIPVINMAVAPTLSTILQGAYMSIYPVGPVVSNTAVGNWVT